MMLMFAGEKLVIGITKGNVDRLLAGKPATVTGPYQMKVREVMVVYGVDKPDILRQLEARGIDFTQAMKDSAAENPE